MDLYWNKSGESYQLVNAEGHLYARVWRDADGVYRITAMGSEDNGRWVSPDAAMDYAKTQIENFTLWASGKPSEPQRCGGCRFYMQHRQVSADEAEWGDCRRNAPRVCREDNAGGFPWVYSSNWCGKWEPKP